MRWLDGITDYYGYEFEEADGDGQVSLVSAVHGVTKSQTWLSNWTDGGTERLERYEMLEEQDWRDRSELSFYNEVELLVWWVE